MLMRWLAAGPLLVGGLLGVPVGLVALSAWVGERAWEAFAETYDLRALDLAGLIAPSLRGLGLGLLPYVGLAIVLLVILRESPQHWRRVTFLFTVPTALICAITMPFFSILAGRYLSGTPALLAESAPAWCGVAVVLGWLLARFAGRMLTRPLASDVARTRFDVLVTARTPGRTKVRLVIGDDRVRLIGLPATRRPRSLSIAFGRLDYVQPGHLTGTGQGATWQLPNGSALPLSDGQVVRIVGSDQQWLVPVDEDAGALAEFLAERRSARPLPEPAPPPVDAEWQSAQHTMHVEQQGQKRRAFRAGSRSRHVFLVAAILIAAGMVMSVSAAEGWAKLTNALVPGLLSAGLFLFWRKLDRANRLVEEWPREPGAAPWGETDPAKPPVSGWTPGHWYRLDEAANAQGVRPVSRTEQPRSEASVMVCDHSMREPELFRGWG